MVETELNSVTDNPLVFAESGEIIIRSPSLMKGYYLEPEKTAETIVDGWLHTGDQARIEDDLRELVPQLLHQADDDVRRGCEAAIRDYDPCISCATHFLKLDLERKPDPCASR